jgi:hypothetical protein
MALPIVHNLSFMYSTCDAPIRKNASAGVGLAYSAGTITTPFWLQQMSDGFTAAALPVPNLLANLGGLYGILSGGLLTIGALTAITGLGSITWQEVPL